MPVDPNLIVGTEHFDDAGVYRLNASQAMVLTVDFFPPLVDDPYTFGRIAAANGLSDVYAMGGKPLCALNIVGFPDDKLPPEVLGEILRGGAERVAAAEAVIVGGHSVRDAEIRYGLAVVGIVHPDRVITNGGARPGDELVLTKPIGSGTLTTAAKQEKIAEAELHEAIEVMVELNAGACAAMLETGVHSATDVTGYGLIGHAFEMAEAAKVCLQLHAASVPLLARSLELARSGVLTRAHKSNLAHVGHRFRNDCPDEARMKLLADAQTSGGLLIAAAPDRTESLLAALARNGVSRACRVGEVRDASNHAVVLT